MANTIACLWLCSLVCVANARRVHLGRVAVAHLASKKGQHLDRAGFLKRFGEAIGAVECAKGENLHKPPKGAFMIRQITPAAPEAQAAEFAGKLGLTASGNLGSAFFVLLPHFSGGDNEVFLGTYGLGVAKFDREGGFMGAHSTRRENMGYTEDECDLQLDFLEATEEYLTNARSSSYSAARQTGMPVAECTKGSFGGKTGEAAEQAAKQLVGKASAAACDYWGYLVKSKVTVMRNSGLNFETFSEFMQFLHSEAETFAVKGTVSTTAACRTKMSLAKLYDDADLLLAHGSDGAKRIVKAVTHLVNDPALGDMPAFHKRLNRMGRELDVILKHYANIQHADVNTENLMLQYDDGKLLLKLIDFGNSHRLGGGIGFMDVDEDIEDEGEDRSLGEVGDGLEMFDLFAEDIAEAIGGIHETADEQME